MQAQTEFDIRTKENKKFSPIARIFRLGRDKSFVTYQDILRFIPEPESELDLVDRVFGILLCAGIPYGEDAEHLMDDGADLFGSENY